jgi:phosphoesterase RecJ-like protein
MGKVIRVNEALLKTIQKRLSAAQRIAVISHARPDGDAVGSVLGLGLALQEVGKQVQMVLSDGVPANFRHLPASDLVDTQVNGQMDLLIVLDCSDLDRVGKAFARDLIPDINIDHHITNVGFAKINLVDTAAVATTAILANAFPIWGLPLTSDVAAALLTGIITDTLGFRTSNMTPQAMRITAKLMEYGANLPTLYERALIRRTFEAARYWGQGLQRLQRQGQIIWTSLTEADRQSVAYPGQDDADLVNVLSAIQDSDIAIIFIEQPSGKVKVSWRAAPDFDVSNIAYKFGGGGHPAAAGAMIEGTLDQVQQKVLHTTQKFVASAES